MRIGGTRVVHLTFIYLNSYYNGKNQWTFTCHSSITPFIQKKRHTSQNRFVRRIIFIGSKTNDQSSSAADQLSLLQPLLSEKEALGSRAFDSSLTIFTVGSDAASICMGARLITLDAGVIYVSFMFLSMKIVCSFYYFTMNFLPF